MKKLRHGIGLAGADETVGIVCADEVRTLPDMGDTLSVGSAGVGLTPRLPIW
jgi:hypothetical protein